MLCQVLLAAAVCCTGLFCYNLFQARTEIVKYDPIARDENTIGMGEYLLPGEADLNYPRPQANKDALQIKWYGTASGNRWGEFGFWCLAADLLAAVSAAVCER